MVNSGLDILGAKVTEKEISGQKPAYHLLVRSLPFTTQCFEATCILPSLCSIGDLSAKFGISGFNSGARN